MLDASTMLALIVFLPLLAAVAVGLSVRIIPASHAQFITCGGMVLSAIFSTIIFMDFAGASLFHAENWPEMFGEQGLVHHLVIAPWITSGDFSVNWAIRVDALTAVMLVVVTWVSAVVHLYSVGYMSHDEHQPRFFAYLSLFTFFMLVLVTSDNFIQLFLGWEGVGLCSYLLIGFWFKKREANAAAMKAFIVNRVGDLGLALGVFAIFKVFGSVEFDVVFAAVSENAGTTLNFLGMELHAITTIGILLFIGCMGKSAQFGLHTWLPDAMEGPTPVSALIHAATMVTAGVFLLARCSPLFEHAPEALTLITLVGAFTAFFAATIGMVQNDIKRVIAYSTCSQLGYMFFACGVGAYAAAIFHLMTHAFFKALLFLSAGSVIHGMSGEQDMQKMGGIRRLMPRTYVLFWMGSLALAGLPFFAGYYSKDMILEAAYAAGDVGRIAFWVGIAAAFMTAFYSWRLLYLTFHGAARADQHTMDHVHESPPVMLRPLNLLVFGTLFSGAIGYYVLNMVSGEDAFWQHSIASLQALHRAHEVPAFVPLMPLVVALLGIGLATFLYIRAPQLPAKIAAKFAPLYRFLLNKWYIDELYDALFVRTSRALGHHLWKVWDTRVIDDLGPNGAASLARMVGEKVAHVQTGFVYHYAFAMLIGLLAIISWVVFYGI